MEENKFNFALHPGVILKDYLKSLKMTQRELSVKTELNKTIINEIVAGKRNITTNIALKFESIFGLPARFWSNLQLEYDEAVLRLKNKQSIKIVINNNTQKVRQIKFEKIKEEQEQIVLNCAV